MRINEVTRETGLSRRAVKYYEEEGLLTVKKIKTVIETTASKILKS